MPSLHPLCLSDSPPHPRPHRPRHFPPSWHPSSSAGSRSSSETNIVQPFTILTLLRCFPGILFAYLIPHRIHVLIVLDTFPLPDIHHHLQEVVPLLKPILCSHSLYSPCLDAFLASSLLI